MKKHTTITYECEICKEKYFTEHEAHECESFQLDPCEYKIGDPVRIKETGKKGKITGFQMKADWHHGQHYVSTVIIDNVIGTSQKNIQKITKNGKTIKT